MRRTSYQYNPHAAAAAVGANMLNAGNDIVPDRKSLAGKREKQGKCPTCGIATHKVGMFGKKTELTIDGAVYKGRCLACHPLEGYNRRPKQQQQQQQQTPMSLPAPPGGSSTPPALQSSHGAPRRPPPAPPAGQGPGTQKRHQMVQQEAAPPLQDEISPMALPTAEVVPVHYHQQQQPQQQQQQRHHPYAPQYPPPPHQVLQQQPDPPVGMQQQDRNDYYPAPAGGPHPHHQHQQQYPPHPMMTPMGSSSGGGGGDSFRVPRTLVVSGGRDVGDDYSVVSNITLDVRLIDDEESVPPIMMHRRPGPDSSTSDEDHDMMRMNLNRPGRSIRPSYRGMQAAPPPPPPPPPAAAAATGSSSGARSSVQRGDWHQYPQPQNIIVEGDGEGYEGEQYYGPSGRQQQMPPLGLDQDGWARQREFMPPGGMDAILNSPRNSAPPSRNNSQEIEFHIPFSHHHHQYDQSQQQQQQQQQQQPRGQHYHHQPEEYLQQIPEANSQMQSSKMSSTDESTPSRQQQQQQEHHQQLADDGPSLIGDGPSLIMENDIVRNISSREYDGNNWRLDTVEPRMPVVSAIGGPPGRSSMQHSTISTSSSADVPLRDMNARGREDSGRIVDPASSGSPLMNGRSWAQMQDDKPLVGGTSPRTGRRRARRDRAVADGGKTMVEENRADIAAEVKPKAADTRPVPSEDLPQKDAPSSSPVAEDRKKKKSSKKESRHRSRSRTKSPKLPDSPKPMARKNEKNKLKQQKQDMHEIPAIMHCLHLDECNSYMREKALDSLAGILWRSSRKGREFILEHNGVDTVTKSMWSDMDSPGVQGAALHLILAMAASPDAIAENDMLSKAESICDTVLFTMQNHSEDHDIQLRGCLIFACLSAASSDNKSISDGSLSGAMMMVLNAMGNHRKSQAIQKAGLQALYHQCSLSVHAEGNKRTFMESRLDSGVSGIDILLRSVEELQDDFVAMEWACRICWCLTSSEDLVKSSANTPLHEAVVPICECHTANPSAVRLIEAAIGTVGNLAHLDKTHAALVNVGAIGMILDAMHYYPNDYGISFESVAALANLAISADARDSLVKSGAVSLVVVALQKFISNPEFAAEGLRALVCLASDSREAKEMMATPEMVDIIAKAGSAHDTSAVHEMSAALISTLAVDNAHCELLIDCGAIDIILRAMDNFTDLKVQDAACSALRNLSCNVKQSGKLLQRGTTESCIVDAMKAHVNSTSIQSNACCTLWNLAFKSEDRDTVISPDGVACIVKAMQSNMESGEVLELACGALWVVVDDSMDLKKDVVANGAIDAVTCAMVMHPASPETLEKACGVLSNVTSEGPLAEAVANSQGVSIIAEAIRNNSSSIPLLEIGCLTLRNIMYFLPDTAPEASPVIASLINAMQDNMGAVEFQKEACNVLWMLAAEEESCQSKMLALDGLSVLMKCLEHNGDDPDVQRAALGAFNQLAAASNNHDDTY
jgi:hypothetical protein